ncbi:MAG: type II secretion system protein [Pseudomonadota bacterium]
MSIRPRLARQAGLTLVELVMFIIIISVAVAGVVGTVARVSARSADPFLRKQAMLRAESLLEEVSLARFTFCHPDDANAETATSAAACATMPEAVGPRAGETRPYFNINDYVGAFGAAASFTAGDTSGGRVVTDVTGAPMLPVGFTALVTIRAVPAFGPSGMQIGAVAAPVNAADTEVLHISVDVGYGASAAEHVVLDTYRTRYAPNSTP